MLFVFFFLLFFFFVIRRRPPRSTRTDTLFPYTTLFRSCRPSTPAWLHPAADPGGPGVALSSAVARPVRYLRHQLMWPPRKAPRPIWHCAWLYPGVAG